VDKPTQIALRFNKVTETMLLPFLESADDKVINIVGDVVVAALSVKGYSLEDHQFIQVKVKIRNGHEVVALIPRNCVALILQGKGGPDPFRIAGSSAKPNESAAQSSKTMQSRPPKVGDWS
jgi:hypothetical protein